MRARSCNGGLPPHRWPGAIATRCCIGCGRCGSLKCVAGKAPRNLRRHTARILMIDEADAIEVSAEDDPRSLPPRHLGTFQKGCV